MTMPLSEDEIAAITEREAKATAGEWHVMPEPHPEDGPAWYIRGPAGPQSVVACDIGDEANARFIAHARTDISRLLHDWRAQKATIDILVQANSVLSPSPDTDADH